MADYELKVRLLPCAHTAAEWASSTYKDKILKAGEIGYEKDTGRYKMGDGETKWASLPWASAEKLSSSAGSATQPIYFSGGKPVACTYSLNKTVPADAKFTDTNTWRGIQNNLTSTSTTESLSAAQGKILNEKFANYLTTSGTAVAAKKLANYYSARQESANLTADGSGGVINFKATGSMKTGKPMTDGHILHFYWDNDGGWDAQFFIPTGNANNYAPQWRGMNNKTWQNWRTFLDSGNYTSYTVKKDGTGATGKWGISISGSSASCTGNAATTTKLATARTINGTSFNGSANITTANWGTARTLTIGNTGKSVNGGGNVSWTLGEIGAAPASGSLNYVKVYNSSNVTSTDNVSVNDLAKQHAAVAMVNNATDNPLGAKKWIHVWNQSWNNGVNTSWVSQIALGVEGSNGMWYRTTQGTIVGATWKRVYDSSYHPLADTSYAVYDKTNTTTKTTFNYGAAGITSPSWFAAWNGYELRAISPANVLSTIKALPLAGGTLTGNLYIRKGKSSAVGAHIYSENSSGTQTGQINIYGNSLSGLFYDIANDVEINTIMDIDGFYIDHPLNGIAYLNPSELYLSAGIATIGGAAYFKTATNYFYNGSYYTAINRPSASANYTLYLPSATGQLVYHTNDTAIGGTGAPVYIAATGAATLVTSVAIGYGGTGATTVAGARGNLGVMAAISANGYYGMGDPSGATNVWIRTTSKGILPYQSGGAGSGHGSLGTSSWYFSAAYIDNVYGTTFHGNNSFIINRSATGGGFYIQNSSTTYGRMYVSTIGTAGNGTKAGTQGIGCLVLGNSTSQSSTSGSGANNAIGVLTLYGPYSGYNNLRYEGSGSYNNWLPASSGTLMNNNGGTFIGAVTLNGSNVLSVGTRLKMWSDSEGGNIRLFTKTSTTNCFEFDGYDGNLRLYYSTNGGSSSSASWAWKTNGMFQTSYLSINGNSTDYRLYVVGKSYLSSTVTSAGEFISTTANGFRITQGNYGAFFRNDGSAFYLLFTASGSQTGSWNSLRPFTANLSSGYVSLGHGLGVTGTVTITDTLYPTIYFKNSTNACYSMFEGSYGGAANLWAVSARGENYRRAIAVYEPLTRTSLINAVTLRMCNAGAWTEYNILHTGHFSLKGTTLTITTA